MTKKQVVIEALRFRSPPYVPWSWGPTQDCGAALRACLGTDDLGGFLDGHLASVGAKIGRAQYIDEHRWRDPYGVVWDRQIDKDIGTPCDWPIKKPQDLKAYRWPDAADDSHYSHIPGRVKALGDRFVLFNIGFSLYERAWTMRGMENLLMDMVERPQFVEGLLDAIAEHNLQQIRRAVGLGVDGLMVGDDYGMQSGLIMGIEHWRHFIKPRLARMFEPFREAGKFILIHSCGRVDSLFEDLIEIGLNCFNPFQPEVMDVFALMRRYHGKLAFHGGMSVQKVLPFGTADEVHEMTNRLIAAGSRGGYIFSPSHSVPRDVPPENLIAMQALLTGQAGYRK